MRHNSNKKTGIDHRLQRRDFITTTIKAAGAVALVGSPVASIAKTHPLLPVTYTVQNVIDIVLKEIPGVPIPQTVDTIKSGSAGQQVTGIVTTMFSTIAVIEEAARLNANFVIAHEPTFYNHIDDVNFVPNNSIVKKKQDLLLKHNIAVWRFHDYWHAYRPDGISTGVLKSAGWQQYFKPNEKVMKMPPATLKSLTGHLKSSLDIAHLRVIGDMDQICERVAIMPGAAGGVAQIGMIEKEAPDVLIVGEVHEWETAEYVRDATSLGSKTALIILGHAVSEEPGMQFLVDWLQPKIPGVQVTHVKSGDPFTWV